MPVSAMSLSDAGARVCLLHLNIYRVLQNLDAELPVKKIGLLKNF